jgi:hypothetical protein
VPCPRRGKWRNKDQKWSSGTIRSIVQNPTYCGTRAYNRFPKNKLSGLPRGKRNDQGEWKTKENAHPAIVSQKLFEEANGTKFFKYAGGTAMAVKSPYLLSGLIRCSHCGFNYSGFTRGKKGLRYYADSGYINKGKSVCDWHAIPKEELEEFIRQSIRERLIDSTISQKLEELIGHYLSSNANSNGVTAISLIEEQIRRNDIGLSNLLAAVETGLNSAVVLARIKEIGTENDRLRIELRRLQRVTISKAVVQDAASDAARFLLSFDDRMERAPLLEQKLMMKRVVDGIVVDRANDRLDCRLLRIPKMSNPILKLLHQNGVVQSNVCPEQDLNLHDLAATSS